jgi:hypothetical protein
MHSSQALATMHPGSKFGLDERRTYGLKSLCENDSRLCGGRGAPQIPRLPRDDKGEGNVFASVCFSNHYPWKCRPLICHPERTRISCHAALDTKTCAPFRKERRMKFAKATKFHRKSGVAEGSAVRLGPHTNASRSHTNTKARTLLSPFSSAERTAETPSPP